MNIGTRGHFRNWLSAAKHITYTQYSKLTPEKRADIRSEYYHSKVQKKVSQPE